MAVLTEDLGVIVFDQDTVFIQVSFTDEEAAALTPNSGLVWTLTDLAGNVINSRSAVPITAASTINVPLSGADLAYADGAGRLLRIVGTYDSSLGSNLPINRQIRFEIEDVKHET